MHMHARETVNTQWIAERLADLLSSWWLAGAPEMRDAVPVVTVYGGLCDLPLAQAAPRKAGRRIVRLAYDYEEQFAAHAYLPEAEFERQVIRPLATSGEALRARVRQARREHEERMVYKHDTSRRCRS